MERLTLRADAQTVLAAAPVRHVAAQNAGAPWTEVDLRGRRTPRALEGRDLPGARLYVDLGGGVFTPVDEAGEIAAPGANAIALRQAIP